MSTLLTNALLCDIDPPRVEAGCLRIDGRTIAARGPSIGPAPGDDVIDCGGAVVLPGLVNGHTHLYSALAVGMPPPPRTPQNFREILELVWWRLDQALDAESIETSAHIGALDALRCGTTTLIDHHASPDCIDGSLDLIRRGIESAGLRGVLCYETTDRHGPDGRDAGLAENRRFLEACSRNGGHRFAGLVGGHASFTLEDESLDALAELAERFAVGVHIHVAEDPCDEDDCQRRYQLLLIDRLAGHGLLRTDSIFAHGTHLDDEAIEQVGAAGVTMAHNPRSNMNNAVGYAPVGKFGGPVMLGTDGIGADMFAEAKHAWFVSRHEFAGFGPPRVLAMLAASARRASAALGLTLGRLAEGAAADVVVTDYRPATPLTSENLAGHFIFGMSANHVRSVIVDGTVRLGGAISTDAAQSEVESRARTAARRLWERMASEH